MRFLTQEEILYLQRLCYSRQREMLEESTYFKEELEEKKLLTEVSDVLAGWSGEKL